MSEIANLDGRSFVMTGPMKIGDLAHTPVRGDLAHVRLAGRYFVPHYAVPALHKVGNGKAPLMASDRTDAAVLAELDDGALFEVLDIAGGKAWGQAGGENGPVGYVSMDRLTLV